MAPTLTSILTLRVNTGFGGLADTRPRDVLELQRVLTRELSYGVLSASEGDPRPPGQVNVRSVQEQDDPAESHHLPRSWVRAVILLRINSLIKGYSGVRLAILSCLQALLTHDTIPMVSLRGSISASGDLSPLTYISSAIQGKPTIRIFCPVKDVYADEALAQVNLQPASLTAKEGPAIVNGTAVSTACGALVLHDTHQLVVLSQILTAMTVEALLGTPASFDALFSQVRPQPGQIETATNIRAFLRGSQLAVAKHGKNGALRQD
ncbi:L-Aspartase-like protein [Aspergillus venezuelensis]